jgi:serine/threonine protein kinase
MEKPWDPTPYEDGKEHPFAFDGLYDNFSNVMKVKGTSGPFKNRKYVLKWLPVGPEDNLEKLRRQFIQEAKNLYLARHGHVVELVKTFIEEKKEDEEDEEEEPTIRLSIVMDRADCDLDAYLKRGRKFRSSDSIQSVSEWFGCLVGAVAYIHGIGIRHRDIKPPNILIKKGIVLLADFGISKTGLGKTFPTTLQGRNASRTKEYCAPEVDEKGSSRGRAADMFSLGAVFLEMLVTARSIPLERADLESALMTMHKTQSYAKTIYSVHQYIVNMERKAKLESWQKEILGLCKRMLDTERDQRPSAEELELMFISRESHEGLKPLWPCKCDGNVPLTEAQKLIQACMKGALEGETGVVSLLASGVDPKTVGAIQQASARDRREIVDRLLKKGADVNGKDYSGQTPLHCAAGFGHEHVVRTLLSAGADVSIKDDEGHTALHSAAAQGHKNIVGLLLERKANMNDLDVNEGSPLHFAARRGHEPVVKILLNRGAEYKFKDDKGRTVLHYAAERGFVMIVKLLVPVMKDGFVNELDNQGETAFSLAEQSSKQSGGQGQHRPVIDLLIKNGAK